MGLLNFNLKMPDLSKISSLKDAVTSKIDELGLSEKASNMTGILSGNGLASSLTDNVMASVQDQMPDFDMGGLMDFDMGSITDGLTDNSFNSDISEMINGMDLNM